jgi:hypothetical protein
MQIRILVQTTIKQSRLMRFFTFGSKRKRRNHYIWEIKKHPIIISYSFYMTTKVNKKSDKPLFKEIIDMIPSGILAKTTGQFKSDKHCYTYKTYDQLCSMMFGQLNNCHSLREISLGIDQSPEFLYDIGLKQSPAKSTMSDGNKKRNYQVFEAIYKKLLQHYSTTLKHREGYQVIEEIKGKSIKIVDATIMSVCLSLFSWAEYRTAKGGIKAHVSLDEGYMVPDIINITQAKVSDRRGVDDFRYPKDAIIVDDRGYFDCKLFKQRVDDDNWFVCRIKDNILYEVVQERELPDEEDQHILLDEEIRLTGKSAVATKMNQVRLRRVVVYIPEGNRTVELITNNMEWKASTIAELYKRRWQIEVFFKLVKQNLQIKTFIGTSENACRAQIWIAMICFLLIEIIRRVICRTKHSYSHCILIIRVCITRYTTLNYVMNQTQIRVRKARKHSDSPPDLFANGSKKKNFMQQTIIFET